MSDADIMNLKDRTSNKDKIYGVMVGEVVRNYKDKDAEPKVRVKFFDFPEIESDWAPVASFMSGNDRGAFFLPEVGDKVLVAFENGNINKPYIVGCLWNGKDKPPEENKEGKNDIRVIKSRSGHVLKFDDKKDEEKIEIKSKTGHTFQMADKKDEGLMEIKTASGHIIRLDDKKGEEKIQIIDKSGANKILIDASEKKLSIVSDKDIELSAPNGKITLNAKEIESKSSAATRIEAFAGLNMKASGDLNVKGANVTVEASAGLKAKGATANVEASGPMTIKGAMVNIN